MVLDAQAQGWVNGQAVEVYRVDPTYFACLGAVLARLSAYQASRETDRELLSDLPVVIRHDMVRVRVEPGDAGGLHDHSGVFLDVADSRFRDRLADLVSATRPRPWGVGRFVPKQDAPTP